MLRFLSVRDFVIVERLELEFQGGFTVLTGETGAGKSILIDALSAAIGERADPALVRVGRERAEVSAEFDAQRLPRLCEWMDANDLRGDGQTCLLRRVIEAGGRSRAFVNGRAVTASQLREAGEMLLDIHGQHAHQSLLRAAVQRELLDGYGGLGMLAAETREAFQRWQALHRTRLEWERNSAALEREREDLAWRVEEIAALSLTAEGWRDLQAEHSRLAHAVALLEGAEQGLEVLSEGEVAALGQVGGAIARLSALTAHDPALLPVVELLESARVECQEAVYALRDYRDRLDLDPERLAEVERRIEAIHSASRKFRVRPEDLPALLEADRKRLAELGAGADAEELGRQEAAARAAFLERAASLGEGRRAAAGALGREVSAAMQELAMAGGRFAVSFEPVAEPTAHGLEEVVFQVSSHEGLPLRPMGKVASGGELSRISLAVQVITSRLAAVPTLIFDEVDSGIGGRVAEIVGRQLRRLGAERQVLCVTHLPQVAAAARHHWQVAKSARDGVVLSEVRALGSAERVEEIARMLGGTRITETSRRHAEEMLSGSEG